MSYNKLTTKEKEVIDLKGTQRPFVGKYDDFYEPGIFICKKCNNPLFTSKAKFDANCGWPAFDDSFTNSIKEIVDDDGVRTEIQCSNCSAHLGHVFNGEQLTEKDTRHCVNSISIKFIKDGENSPSILKES